MSWNFDESKPIYIQLVEVLKLNIISGKLASGEKLLSVRDLAEEAGVNPNTMQKALAELERQNLVYSQRTSGRFVTEDMEHIESERLNYANEKIKEVINTLISIGYTRDELLGLISKQVEKEAECSNK